MRSLKYNDYNFEKRKCVFPLKTLFNIMEAPLIFFLTLMSVLFDDLQMDQ